MRTFAAIFFLVFNSKDTSKNQKSRLTTEINAEFTGVNEQFIVDT
jgi:hypothetical protein